MASGWAGNIWFGVRRSILSVVVSDIARLAALETVILPAIPSSFQRSLRPTSRHSGVIGIKHAPHILSHAYKRCCVLLSTARASLTRAKNLVMALSLPERTSTTGEAVAKDMTSSNVNESAQPLPRPLRDVKTFRMLAATRTHASTHAFVEIADNCNHLGWYTRACEYIPQHISVASVARVLLIDEPHLQGGFYISSDLLEQAHDQLYIR